MMDVTSRRAVLSEPPRSVESGLLRVSVLCALALGLGTLACSASPIACRVRTDAYTAPEDGTATYHAVVTGSATIKSIVYGGGDDAVTESNPTLPFEVQVSVPSGASIDITVYGSIDNGADGNVLADYGFLGASGATYTAHASCR